MNKNGTTNAGRSDVTDPLDVDAGIGSSAPISPEEAAALRGEAPPETPDDDVQPDAESADKAGEQADGEESPESGDEPGAESEGDLDGEAVFKDALRMANGDPKKALEIARLALGMEGDGKKSAAEAAPESSIEKSIAAEVDRDVAAFYEERGTEEKPGDERKALTKLLTQQRVAMVESVAAVLDNFEAKLQTKTKVNEATKALWKEYPGWKKDEVALTKFIAEVPSRRNLPPLDAYELFLAKKAKRGGPADAKKAAAVEAAATRKQVGTAAAAAPGGRPLGPTDKKPLTTEQREILTLREQPRRFTLP